MYRFQRARAAPLLAAIVAAAAPAVAQNACQDALKQLQQQRSQVALTLQNAENQLTTAHSNAILDCEKLGVGPTGDPKAVVACEQKADTQFADRDIDLKKAANTAYSSLQQVENDIEMGPGCSWTPEEVTQFVAQAGQALAQLEQGTAAIIAAAKGTKPATSTGGAGAGPPPAPRTPASNAGAGSNAGGGTGSGSANSGGGKSSGSGANGSGGASSGSAGASGSSAGSGSGSSSSSGGAAQ